jgi:hypothetical protein
MARSTTRFNQRPDTLMQDRISQVEEASCNARPDHTLGSKCENLAMNICRPVYAGKPTLLSTVATAEKCQQRNWPLLDHFIEERRVASFSRIAVSEIRHGERKYFQPVVIMDPHGPSRPVLVEEADTVRRELARHSGRVLAGRTNVAEIGAVGIEDVLVVAQMKIIQGHRNSPTHGGDRLPAGLEVQAERGGKLFVTHDVVAFTCAPLEAFAVEKHDVAAPVLDQAPGLQSLRQQRHRRPSDTHHLPISVSNS